MAHRQVCVCMRVPHLPRALRGTEKHLVTLERSLREVKGPLGNMAALLIVFPLLIMGIWGVPVMGLPLSWEETEHCIEKDF